MNKTSRQCRKFLYYASSLLQFGVPRAYFQRRLDHKLRQASAGSCAAIHDRVEYYNQLKRPFELGAHAVRNGSLRPGQRNTYVFDLLKVLRYFDADLKVHYLFGDIMDVPDVPTLVKSRPISPDNQNSVLMKLNQIRHFYFVPCDVPFERKVNGVVWRGKCGKKKARIDLLEKHAFTPRCDIGDSDTRRQGHPHYKGFLSVKEQLRYKFILSVEGNDVATNLKWVLSSNSLCLMAKPRFETWFMEGRLIPNHHYVLLKDDYSDLEEKMDYYSSNTSEALDIIRAAHAYVEPFKDRDQEELIALLVMQKYFRLSNQQGDR